MVVYAIDEIHCPVCFGAINRTINPEPPHQGIQAGDIMLCNACYAILVIEPVGLRLATQAELDGFTPSDRERIRKLIRVTKKGTQ